MVPGKLVAFRGPRELGGASYRDRGGVRYFSPAFFVPILRELGATTVLQLDDPAYDPAAFAAAGIAHHRLPSDDSPTPTPAAASSPSWTRRRARWPCTARRRLGRTGTLIALYLMRRYGFAAREAMGWLRVMRPGSVIGEQQHFLEAVGEGLRARRQGGTAVPRRLAVSGSAAARRLAEEGARRRAGRLSAMSPRAAERVQRRVNILSCHHAFSSILSCFQLFSSVKPRQDVFGVQFSRLIFRPRARAERRSQMRA